MLNTTTYSVVHKNPLKRTINSMVIANYINQNCGDNGDNLYLEAVQDALDRECSKEIQELYGLIIESYTYNFDD